jgi:hypothetical protein
MPDTTVRPASVSRPLASRTLVAWAPGQPMADPLAPACAAALASASALGW